ncbi:MAG: hypothetical protein ACK40O_09865, partial [Allosphingosinicella sp.]
MKVRARHLAIGALAVGAAACVPRSQPQPEPPAPVRPVPTAPVADEPPPPPAPNWEQAPLSPGDWYYSREGNGSQASFGAANSEGQFVVRCDRARRQIVLSREGRTNGRSLIIRTTGGARSLPATAQAEPLAYVSAALPASDPFLDAMVFSRGRIAVEAARRFRNTSFESTPGRSVSTPWRLSPTLAPSARIPPT